MILNEKGQTVNRSLFDSSIAIVDIGHRTTDVFMVQSGQGNRQGCVGFMLGIFDIQGALESRISIAYGTLTLADRIKIFDWLAGGPVPRIRRNLLDETELKLDRDIAMKELINNLRENVLGCITPLGVDELYLTGGGAALLRPMIQAMDPTVRVCENPQFSNVIGFYRTLMV